jgi:hypothetical protein
MQELRAIETSQLIDLLAQHTADYTKMMSEGTTKEEYEKCNLMIKALQAEIEVRKKSGTITPNPETDITLPPDFIT